MARLNIEDSLFDDPRYIKLCAMMKSEARALGWWVKVARLAQSYWKHDKQLIPKEVYKFNRFPKHLIESKMVEQRINGFYLSGSEKNFAWIVSQVSNGQKGGRPPQHTENMDKRQTHGQTHSKPTGKPTRNPLTLTLTPSQENNINTKDRIDPEKLADVWNRYFPHKLKRGFGIGGDEHLYNFEVSIGHLTTFKEWEELFEQCKNSDWLMGKTEKASNWFNFLWILKYDNIQKVQNGTFDNENKNVMTIYNFEEDDE